MDFEISILGPVELRTEGRPDPLGSAKIALMLAALALDVGKPVALDTLIEQLWDGDPPGKPRASLHSCAAKIRRRLPQADAPGSPSLLVQRAHTYTLAVDPEAVDWHRFNRLVAQARSLADSGDDAQALALLRQAEGLWRGEPLAGLGGLWAENVRATLLEGRLAATLTRIAIEFRRGCFAELVGELSALVARYPTDETLIRHLMVAGYGSGRQADALRTYDLARRRLKEELGADPGEALSRAHRLILNRAPVSELLTDHAPNATATSTGAATAAPNNLPGHAELVGRHEEMGTLQAVLQAPEDGGAVIALQTITGMGGVGKSLLALHAARRLAKRFPAGQLYIDLQAHSAGRHPLTPEAALTTLLRLLGVPATAVPHDLDELTSLWRTMLASRRAVIVLDDAAGPEQVRPLLPGSSSSLIIITSRRRLAGLPGVRPLFLDVLPTDDATALFRRLVGPERSQDANDVANIARLCGHLPLALELAAGRMVSRPSWTTSHLIQRLSRAHGRLNEIRDVYTDIARVFEMSYNTLTAEQQTVFRLLGLHLAPEFGPHSAAALTGLPLEETERIIESLLDAHLLSEPAPDRYRFHDLLGEYALTLTVAEDTEEDRDRAVQRLIDFHLNAAAQADRMIYPRRARLDLHLAPSPCPLPTWPDAQDAKRWLTAERTALVAAERHARTHHHPAQAAQFAHVLAGFLDAEGYWAEAQRMHDHAATHWRTTNNPRAEARALIDLSATLAHSARYPQAVDCARRALTLAQNLHDPTAEAEAVHLLGVLHWHLGRLDEALTFQREALEIRSRSGDQWQVARSQNNLGITLLHLASHLSAKDSFEAALKGFREVGDHREESHVLNNMSDLFLSTGDRESARQALENSLRISTATGSRSDQAVAQCNLANILNLPEDLEAALDLYRQALFSFRQLGDRRNESIALNSIGSAFHAAGRDHEAAVHHRSALALAKSIGAALEETQALRCLGLTELRLGDLQSASDHLEAALDLARRLRFPEEQRRALDTLTDIRLQLSMRDRATASGK
ncbi:AfsR/SARP family transcriptional regulator [Streptomyces sparsogenes]|uniref:Putative AfsR-like transcriptional regulator n=1 Tax=Streptomyces sparsogenes DSM 40356 TaxID=1331668 RepID=A0A1R1SPE3_9ACTN|nr:BTAD domain-containing putative transcriptional regulator [Streptomyces sparsogenes]OMI40123.1 putative AfsR-like transcriptional regulator [Streptomyces sparsogenes DSM 40356]